MEEFYDLILSIYSSNENYKIEYTENHSNLCVIYFTSNGLYYPNTIENFTSSVIEKDKYEWYKTRVQNAKKHIFIRDVCKQWYVDGINEHINSIDELTKFFIKETKGYDVITVGSSAGGYAAVLFGTLLNAKRVFCFSPQFNFKYYLENNKLNYVPFVDKYKNKLKKNRYFNLIPFIKKSSVPIFYFFPYHSKEDNHQYNYVKDLKNVYCFKINSKNHGTAVYNFNTNFIINKSTDEMIDLYKNYEDTIINKELFAFKSYGFIKGFSEIYHEVSRKAISSFPVYSSNHITRA